MLGGVAAIAAGVAVQKVAPQPSAAAEHPANTTTPAAPVPAPPDSSTPAPTGQTAHGLTLPASHPTAVSIPAIDVHSALTTLGRNPDGSIQVPQMGPDYNKAAWYKYSPSPGALGPAVILGHIDSAKLGPSVFFRLGAMKPGNTVSVTRADGTVAVFTVNKVEEYPKSSFPTLDVYGNTPNAQLRLITCGGAFNAQEHSYVDNIVVYATLTGSHPA
ncbi:MAG: class F sortase [Sciscionella sp.]